MPRYIDADKLAKHKFLYITHDRYVSDARPKSDEEVYAYKVGYNNAIDDIALFAPTAAVVPRKRGKWVQRKFAEWDDDSWYGLPYCSECGAAGPLLLGFSPNYCSNCGAEMTGEQDEEV